MKKKFTFLMTAMALIFAIMGPRSVAWGQSSITLNASSGFKSSYSSSDLLTIDDFEFSHSGMMYNTKGTPSSWAVKQCIQARKSGNGAGTIYNTTEISNIVSIVVELVTADKTFEIYYGNTQNPNTNSISSSTLTPMNSTFSYINISGATSSAPSFIYTFDLSGSNASYFKFVNGSAASYIGSITINYSSSAPPTCTIDPTSRDFGEIAVGGNATFGFTVTTANLTEDLTLAVSEGFSVSPTTIESTVTETTVTVTCAPTAVGALDGTLTISGGGLTDDVTATLSATGLCTAPANELSYETPIALTLTGTEVETTLTPSENTGNGGTITYELIEGDDTHAIVDGNTFMAEAVGSYTVRATQDLNGTTCGGTFDIVINVTSTSPTCFVDQTEWDFGNVAIGTPAYKTFTVTTANLIGNLTLYMYYGSNFSVSPTTIEQNATETEITVTCTATTAGELEDILTISGGGLADEVEVVLTATGAELYTVSFSVVNGTEPAQQQQTAPEAAIILPSIADVDCNAWQFAGWSESEISTEAPTLLAGGNYTPTENVTLYAVYKKAEASEPTQVPFVFADIAEANNWQNSHAYTSVVIDPVTITANGGGNNGKYYTSDQTWRMYNGGSVTITSTGNNITAVSSNPSKTFTINDGIASLNITATTNFKSITVTCTPPTSFSYSTTPSCLEIVATPTITPNGGEFIGSQEITLACTTEGATISYTTDDWENSNNYSAPFTITATTTLKVKATKEGMSESEEASATFTKIQALETIQAIFDASATAGNYYVTFNNWVVSGVNGSNAYVTDGTKGFIVYNNNHGFEVGDQISGTAQLALTRYNGAAEFTNLTATTQGISVTEGDSVSPVTMTIDQITSGVYTGAVITIKNVTYNSSDELLSDGANTIKPYNKLYSGMSFTNDKKYNVTGVYLQYNSIKEIMPRSAADIEEIVPTEPSITVAETLDIPYTGLEELETLEVTYENIDFEMLDLYFYDNAGCTIESENDWFIADFTEDGSHNIEYSASENTESTPRTVYMQIYYLYNDGESELTKVITVTQEAAPQTYNVTLSSNGVVNEPQPVQGSITLSDPTIIPTEFTFAGWTESESESEIQFVANPYTPTSNVILYAVFSRVEGGIAGSGNYEKVTSALTDWRGDYLIAYSDEVFMDGSLAGGTNGVGKAQTHVSPESALSGNTISAAWGDEHYVTIEAIDDADLTKGYVIKSHSTTTPYFYQTTNDNGMACTANKSTAAAYPITVTLNTENDVRIALGGKATGAVLRYNNTSGSTGEMFRYYKNCGQQPIYLYKKDAGAPGTTHHYTRVFLNETAKANITIGGPSIIPASSTLNMGTNTLVNENAANLVIEDGGQLIHHNAGVQATMRKKVTAYLTTEGVNNGWYFVASPIAALTSHNLNSGTFDLYKFEQSADKEWKNYESTTFSITNKEGYLYANAANKTIEFVGTLNATDGSKTLAYENVRFAGFNLIGNPFACNATIGRLFYRMNSTGTEIFLEGETNAIIAPCEGVFVQAQGESESVSFSKATSRGGQQREMLSMTLSQGSSTIDRAIIQFGKGETLDKFMLNTSNTKLFIPQNDKEFAAVATQATAGEMPVSFKASKDGKYTISVNTENVEANYLHLIDNLTGMDTDLLSTPSYTFDAKTSDYASRFKLVFGVKNDNEEMSQASSFAYISNGEIVISNEGRATLQVIDVLGRIVSSEEINGEARISTNGLTAGLYILNLNGNVQKIVVR